MRVCVSGTKGEEEIVTETVRHCFYDPALTFIPASAP